MNYRLFCPSSGPQQTCIVNGRTYTGVPGTPQDVPDFDMPGLRANGWTNLGVVGTTAQRPVVLPPGVKHFVDTTINKIIYWDGATWRDMLGASV